MREGISTIELYPYYSQTICCLTLLCTVLRFFVPLTTYTEFTVCSDMTFDDDTKLFGLMRRYSDLEEADELKRQVVAYVRTQIHDVNAEIEQFKTQSAT